MAIDTYTQLSVKDSPESDRLGTIIWKISRMYVIRANGGGLRTLRTLNFLRLFATDQVKMRITSSFIEGLYV